MEPKIKKMCILLAMIAFLMLSVSSYLKMFTWRRDNSPVVYYKSKYAPTVEIEPQQERPKAILAPPAIDMSRVSSASHSIATVIDGTRQLRVGDTLLVNVEMRDFAGRAKSYGGDFLSARMFNSRLGAAASGVVTDHGNGSYTVAFRVSWPGDSQLHVVLVNPSEAVAVLERTREAVPDKVSFWGTFVSEKEKSKVPCHVYLNTTGREVCDFTDPILGESWMCEKPEGKPCYSLEGYSSYNKYPHVFSKQESQLFSKRQLRTTIKFQYMIQALPSASSPTIPPKKCVPGLGLSKPSGFYHMMAWQSSMCTMRHFNTPAAITACLRHKVVHMFGDSTIRQYWEFLTKFVKGFKPFDLHKPGIHQPRLAIDTGNNIMLKWFCQAYPLITGSYTFKEDVRYTANRIDEISGGSEVAIGICLGAHFTVFPLEVFRKRMENIAEAVRKLLLRSPETKVIVKLANTRDSRNLEIFNNWNTFRMNEITLEVFEGLNVAYIDAWDMTLSINSYRIHPKEHIVKNQVDLFLSYIC